MAKRDLVFRKPWMNAAGSLGFTPQESLSDMEGLGDRMGAFVTNPISLRPRTAAAQPALIEYPGGFLLHSGLPNPGLNSVIKKYARRWDASQLPVIVHLIADRPEETKQMVQSLENLENVVAAELGFAPLLADDILLLTLEMCLGELPLVFSLDEDKVLTLGPRLVQAGASAISLAPPRGALPLRSKGSPNPDEPPSLPVVHGRLFGPALFPRALELVTACVRLGLPIIGAGGVYSRENAEAMLSTGALAVQLDAAVWLPKNKKDFA